MASKQLEILVKARDEASATLRGVGSAVEEVGAKQSRLDALVGEAKGFRATLRNAKALFLAVQVGEVGFAAITASYKTLTGTAYEAAAAQQELTGAISQIPIIGKLAAKVTTELGDSLAKALGKQTTAEINADAKDAKEALESLGKFLEHSSEEITKLRAEASVSGLTGFGRDAVEAQNKLEGVRVEIDRVKRAMLSLKLDPQDPNYQATLEKIAQANAQINQLTAIEQRLQIKQAQDLSSKLAEIHWQRTEKIYEIEAAGQQKRYEAQGRGYAAERYAAEEANRKAISEATKKASDEIKAIDKAIAVLQQAAAKKNNESPAAQAAIKKLQTERQGILNDFETETHNVNKNTQDTEDSLKKKTLEEERLFLLQQQSALGDKEADARLKQLEIEKEFNAQRKNLLDLIRDSNDEEEKGILKKQLADVDKTEREALQKAGTITSDAKPAKLEEARLLTGVSQQIQAQKSVEVKLDNIGSLHQQTNDKIQQLLDKLPDWLKDQGVPIT